MTDWDRRFMQLAEIASTWVKGDYTSVGACVVHPGRRRFSMGYCGFPRNVEDHRHRLEDPELRRAMSLHAEVNAILNADESVDGWTMYCTVYPCSQCAGVMIQAGILRLVCPEPEWSKGERWHYEAARDMLHEAGVRTDHVELPSRDFRIPDARTHTPSSVKVSS